MTIDNLLTVELEAYISVLQKTSWNADELLLRFRKPARVKGVTTISFTGEKGRENMGVNVTIVR